MDPDYFNSQESTLKLVLDADSYYNLAKDIYEAFAKFMKSKFDWIRSGFFNVELKEDLIKDSELLISVLNLSKDWDSTNDRKTNALFDLCSKKHLQEKILIFTQYADTANYLIKELRNRGLANCECVTGDSEDPTSFAYRFSPISNQSLGYRILIMKLEF